MGGDSCRPRAQCLVIPSGVETTTLLMDLHSIPLEERHVTLLIHEQHSLLIVFHAF